MYKTCIFLTFVITSFNSEADMLCDMYGQDDVLCQSERLGNEYTRMINLDSKCRKGDDSACRELGALRKEQRRNSERRASANDIYKLRMKCYEYDNQEACDLLRELQN